MGIVPSVFRMALNRKQNSKDIARVFIANSIEKEKLKEKIQPTNIKAKIKTEGDRKN